MTLISLHNSEGCVGRCDAKCYDARGGQCSCICGGLNHGAGKRQAVANTRETLVERLKQSGKVELAEELQQLSLAIV